MSDTECSHSHVSVCNNCQKHMKVMSDLLKVIGNPGQCRGCGAIIFWAHTKLNKPTPLNPDGTTHWATCPKERMFRKQEADKAIQKRRS